MEYIGYIIAAVGGFILILLSVVGFFLVRYFRQNDEKESKFDKILLELQKSNTQLNMTVKALKDLVDTIKSEHEDTQKRLLRAELDIIGAGIAGHVKEEIG